MIKLVNESDEFDQIKKRSERGNADIKKAADILGMTVRDLINDAADFVGKDSKSVTSFDVAHLVNSVRGYEAAKSVFKESKSSRRRRTMRESVGGTVVLKNLDTSVIPVVDFGCYWGELRSVLDDVFVYEYIELDNIDPDDEYYDEIVELVDEKYDGTDAFYDQVLRLAPGYIQDALDEYGAKIKVIPSSCKWYHPREYNFGDDVIQFDASVDTAWVDNKFRELSRKPDFAKYLKKEFSSYDGFISFMPDDVDSYNELLDPNSSDYWKVVCAIVGYLISEDTSIRDHALYDLEDTLLSNPDFIRCSSYDIF